MTAPLPPPCCPDLFQNSKVHSYGPLSHVGLARLPVEGPPTLLGRCLTVCPSTRSGTGTTWPMSIPVGSMHHSQLLLLTHTFIVCLFRRLPPLTPIAQRAQRLVAVSMPYSPSTLHGYSYILQPLLVTDKGVTTLDLHALGACRLPACLRQSTCVQVLEVPSSHTLFAILPHSLPLTKWHRYHLAQCHPLWYLCTIPSCLLLTNPLICVSVS